MKKKSVRLLVLFTLLLLSACGCQRKKDEQANRLVKDLKANAWVIEGTDSTDDPKMTLTFSNRKASFNLDFSSIDYSVDDESNSVQRLHHFRRNRLPLKTKVLFVYLHLPH